MEILPVAILLSIYFIGNIFVLRFFLSQISKKIDQLSSNKLVDPTFYTASTVSSTPVSVNTKPDRPAKNEVMDEQNEIDFDESMQIVPKNIKLEVEGGDSFAPPGFSVK